MSNENLKLFFEKLSLIHKKYEILEFQDEDFNIFSILRKESDEVNLHSKFISELLKNKKYGKTFLKLFLKELEVEVIEIENSINVISVEYQVESESRIDILIEIRYSTYNKAIVIENKIYAEDQLNQLQRYYKGIEKMGYTDEEIEIIYLTLDGESPSDYSLGTLNKEKVKNISYRENIINWIEKCSREVVLVPIIRETLFQYKILLENMTMRESEEELEEMKKIILGDTDYLKVAYSMIDVLNEIKIETQIKFWNLLEKEMEEFRQKYDMKKEGNIKINPEYTKELIEKFYKNNQKKYYGLMYLIKENCQTGEKIYLRIELCENIYWGIIVIENIDKKSNFDRIMKELNFNTKYSWAFKHLKGLDDRILNFKNCDFELARVIQDEIESKKLIKKIVNDIEKEYLILKEKFFVVTSVENKN